MSLDLATQYLMLTLTLILSKISTTFFIYGLQTIG